MNEKLSVANLAVHPLLVPFESTLENVVNPVVRHTKRVPVVGRGTLPLEAVPYGTVVSLASVAVFGIRAFLFRDPLLPPILRNVLI